MTQSGPFTFTRGSNGVQPSGGTPFRFIRELDAVSHSGTPTRWERSTPVIQILGPNYQHAIDLLSFEGAGPNYQHVIDLLSFEGAGPNYQHVIDLWPSATSTLGFSSTASEVAIFSKSAITNIELNSAATYPPPKEATGALYQNFVDQLLPTNSTTGPIFQSAIDQNAGLIISGPIFQSVIDQFSSDKISGPLRHHTIGQFSVNEASGALYQHFVGHFSVDKTSGGNYQHTIGQFSSINDQAGPIWQEKVRGPLRPITTVQFDTTNDTSWIYNRSLSSTVEFSTDDFVNRNYDVTADNTLELNSTAAEVVAYMANAATTVEFSTVNTRFRETFHMATTMVEFGTADALNHNLDVTADNTINFSVADVLNHNLDVTADNTIILGTIAIGAAGGIPVAAFTTVEFEASMPVVIVNNEIMVTATTNIEFGASATQNVPTIVVDAANSIEFAANGVIVKLAFLLNASNTIEFSIENVRDRIFEVSADTILELGAIAIVDKKVIVNASTSVVFGQGAFHVVKLTPSSRRVRLTTIRNISNGIVTLNLIQSRRGLTITPQDVVEVNAAELDSVQINKLRGDFVITVDPF